MNRIIIGLLLLILVSCGTQRRLSKTYVGNTASFLEEQLGKPKTVLDQGDAKIYIYEKSTQLQGTEIKQGKLTLDPIVTPRANKTERYFFKVREDKVVEVKFEEEYER